MKLIVLKIGTVLLTNAAGEIDLNFLNQLASQTKTLLSQGYSVFIISSGAVNSDPRQYLSAHARAAFGQPKLLFHYYQQFQEYGLCPGFIQFRDQDFEDQQEVESRLLELKASNSVVIINANDATRKTEEDCQDNDQLLEMICSLPALKPDYVLIGIDQPGLLNSQGKLIPEVNTVNLAQSLSCCNGGNPLGKNGGGMQLKVIVLWCLSSLGQKVLLAPAQEADFMLHSIAKLEGIITTGWGTSFNARGS